MVSQRKTQFYYKTDIEEIDIEDDILTTPASFSSISKRLFQEVYSAITENGKRAEV